MAIAVIDTRLLEGTREALHGARALDLPGRAAAIRDLAVALLSESHGALQAAVAAEDAEETEALEAEHDLRTHRAALDDAFGRLYFALHAGVLARRASGALDADAEELSHYLDRESPSGFAATRLAAAISQLERARGYADRYVPEAFRADVLPRVDAALDGARAAHTRVTHERAAAVQALARLDAVRDSSREAYLSARDLLSAALRLAGQHDSLGQLMPGLFALLHPRSRGSRDSASTSPPAASAPGSSDGGAEPA